MKEYGARLVDSGFHIVPIFPENKKPGIFKFGKWQNYPGWQKFGNRLPNDAELDLWSTWPDAGIGVICGPVLGIDIDTPDADQALKLEALCTETFGHTPAKRVGLPPKRLLLYRTETKIPSFSFNYLDILSHGRQFVAYGIHPKTRQPYQWIEEPLVELDIEDLPIVTSDKMTSFIQTLSGYNNGILSKKEANDFSQRESLKADDTYHEKKNLTPGHVAYLLNRIGNDNLRYDIWLRCGMAIKKELGDFGFELFRDWSELSKEKYDEKTTIKVWKSLKPRTITGGTLFRILQDQNLHKRSQRSASSPQ